MTGLNTLERDDLLRRIAWLNARIDKLERMLKGEQVGTARIADAAITNAKIKDLTWDKAQGGTATLGGLANVNGVLEIKDDVNTQIGKWDKDGILIKDGKLEIRNDNDTISIDPKGIVSTANFAKSDVANGSLNQVITSDVSYTDITNATLTFTLDRPTTILFIADFNAYLIESVGNTASSLTWIFLDNVSQVPMYFNSGNTSAVPIGSHLIKEVAAGTHTVKLSSILFNKTGNPTLTIMSFKLSYLLLGT